MKHLLTLITLFIAQLFFGGQAQAQTDLKTNHSVIIKFNNNIDKALINSHGGKVKRSMSMFNAVAATLPSAAVDALKKNPNIQYIETDGVAQAFRGRPAKGIPATDPQVTPWGIDAVKATNSWAHSTGVGVKVCVVDSGAGPNLDLNIKGGYDFVNNDADPSDDAGHGTHVSGTIAGLNNAQGVLGVAYDVDLYAVKVLDRRGYGSYSDIVAGMEWCIQNGMNIINMSLGGEGDSLILREAAIAALNANIVTVVAAGNDATSGNNLQYPAIYEEVIAVAATDVNNEIASFSSHGYWVDIAAPGVNVLSTLPGDVLDYYNGTSMATPHVAGIAALLMAANPEMTAVEVRERLISTATDLGTSGWDEYFGAGLVNAYDALFPPVPLTNDVAIKITTPASANVNDVFTAMVEVTNQGLVNEYIQIDVGNQQQSLWLFAGETIGLPFQITANASAGDMQVTATVTIALDEDLSNNQATTTVKIIDPTNTPVMHVSSISYTASKRNLTVRINVTDAQSGAVAGAEVNITLNLDGANYASGTSLTDDTGSVSFRLRNAPSGNYTTTIDSVVKDAHLYDEAANATDPGYTK